LNEFPPVLGFVPTIPIITDFWGKGRAKVWHLGGKDVAFRWQISVSICLVRGKVEIFSHKGLKRKNTT